MSLKEIRIVSTHHTSPIKHLVQAIYNLSKSLSTQDEELGTIFFTIPVVTSDSTGRNAFTQETILSTGQVKCNRRHINFCLIAKGLI